MKSITKDEIFLLKLFELSFAKGSAPEEIDRYVVGRAVGQNDRSVDNTVRMLAQTNFVKKGNGDALYITTQGMSLVEELQAQRV